MRRKPLHFLKFPTELIARSLKKHDASLAITVEAVLYKLRQNQQLTLVDVRSREDFERLYIPGSVNIALFVVKTKTYLKSAPVVLVNEGFRYAELEDECRRLAKRGFKVSILDGGLPAWQRKGGQLTGDLFALDVMKNSFAPSVFPGKRLREHAGHRYLAGTQRDIQPAYSLRQTHSCFGRQRRFSGRAQEAHHQAQKYAFSIRCHFQ